MPSKDEEDQHNSVCYYCKKGGDLLCCDTCNLVFHIKCLKPPLKTVPKGTWHCPVCVDEKKNNKRKKPSSSSSSKRTKSLIVRGREDKTTMTEVEAFPRQQYAQLFKLLKQFHQDTHITLSSLKQLKDLLLVADVHSMSILLSAHDVYEMSEKKTYDILFCIDTFERVYLLNFPQGFVDLDALERVKNQKRMRQASLANGNNSSFNNTNNSNSNSNATNANGRNKIVLKKNDSNNDANGNVTTTTTTTTTTMTGNNNVSKPKTHVLLRNLTRNKVMNNNVINLGSKQNNQNTNIVQYEKELGISNSSPKVIVTKDKSVEKSYARNLSQKLL